MEKKYLCSLFFATVCSIILLSCSVGTDYDDTMGLEITSDFDDPVIEILSPMQGDTLSGDVILYFNVSDFTGVDEVQLWVNQIQDTNLENINTANINSLEWNTRLLKGDYDIKLVAVDAFGNTGQSDSINVTIKNLIFQEFYNTSNSALEANNVVDIQFDSEGKAFVATQTGIYIVSGDTWSPITIEEVQLERESIISIYMDQFDSLWVSSSVSTNQYHSRIYFSYKNGQARIGSKEGLTYDTVRDFFRDVDGTLWLATSDGMYNIIDGKVKKSDEPNSSIVYDVVGNKFGYPIMSNSDGIYNFNGDSWIKVENSDKPCSSLTLDSDGVVWCIDNRYGISSAFKLYRIEDNILEIYQEGDIGKVMTIDQNNNFWFGGKNRVDNFGEGVVTSYDISIDRTPTHNYVNTIEIAPDGKLWIGTLYGLIIAEY